MRSDPAEFRLAVCALLGDRSGQVADPFGYRWTLATKTRDVSPEEIAKAAAAWTSGCDSA